jgi:maltose/moltooligosaccharide transporter
MGQLAVVQFFTWLALLLYVDLYNRSSDQPRVRNQRYDLQLYNDGADWVGVLFGVYSGFAAMFAFLLPILARYTSRKITHAISLTAEASDSAALS